MGCVQSKQYDADGLEMPSSHAKPDDSSVAGGKKVKPSKKTMAQATDSVAAFNLLAGEEGGVVGRAFPEISTAGGVKLKPSAAAFAHTNKLNTYHRVVQSKTHTFACLFEGYGGTATAAYLQRSAYAVFCTAMRRCANTAEALEAMMPELDDALVRTAKSDLGKAATGAAAAIAVFDHRSHQLYAVTVGGCAVVVSRKVGDGEAATAEADVVADGRAARLATYWMRNMKAPDAKSLEAARRHVIGYGVAKDKWLAEAYAKTNKSPMIVMSEPCPPIICHRGQRQLMAGDGHVMLLSSGLLDIVTCTDSAVLADAFTNDELSELFVLTQGTQGNNAFGFNLSSMLARYAAAKLDDMPEPERLCSDVAAVNVSIHFPHYEGCVTPDRNSPMMMPWMQGGRQFKSHKVAYRWRLVLTHISFLIKRRRAIHNLWFETLRNLRQLADKQARQVDMINMRRLNEEHMVNRPGTHLQSAKKADKGSPRSVGGRSSVGNRSVRSSVSKDTRLQRIANRRAASNETPIKSSAGRASSIDGGFDKKAPPKSASAGAALRDLVPSAVQGSTRMNGVRIKASPSRHQDPAYSANSPFQAASNIPLSGVSDRERASQRFSADYGRSLSRGQSGDGDILPSRSVRVPHPADLANGHDTVSVHEGGRFYSPENDPRLMPQPGNTRGVRYEDSRYADPRDHDPRYDSFEPSHVARKSTSIGGYESRDPRYDPRYDPHDDTRYALRDDLRYDPRDNSHCNARAYHQSGSASQHSRRSHVPLSSHKLSTVYDNSPEVQRLCQDARYPGGYPDPSPTAHSYHRHQQRGSSAYALHSVSEPSPRNALSGPLMYREASHPMASQRYPDPGREPEAVYYELRDAPTNDQPARIGPGVYSEGRPDPYYDARGLERRESGGNQGGPRHEADMHRGAAYDSPGARSVRGGRGGAGAGAYHDPAGYGGRGAPELSRAYRREESRDVYDSGRGAGSVGRAGDYRGYPRDDPRERYDPRDYDYPREDPRYELDSRPGPAAGYTQRRPEPLKVPYPPIDVFGEEPAPSWASFADSGLRAGSRSLQQHPLGSYRGDPRDVRYDSRGERLPRPEREARSRRPHPTVRRVDEWLSSPDHQHHLPPPRDDRLIGNDGRSTDHTYSVAPSEPDSAAGSHFVGAWLRDAKPGAIDVQLSPRSDKGKSERGSASLKAMLY